jgi:hypothetical protein
MDGYTANQQNPFSWQNELQNWTKTGGLQNYLQTGLQDSTIGKSGFFDQATQQAQALRAQNLAQVAQAIGNAPTAGIDPAQAVAAQQAQQARALQQREAARQGGWQTARANQQTATDWINQMLGSTSQAITKEQQEWQNYQQAMLQAAAQNQSSTNALIGSGIGAVGTIAGGALAGPLGAGLGGSLAGMASKGLMPSGGYSSMGAAQSAAPYASSYGNIAGMGYVPRAQYA